MSDLASPVAGGTASPSVPARDTGRAIVQVSKVWPGAGAWPSNLTTYLEALSAEEAWAPGLGSAEIAQTFGSIRQPDKAGFFSYGVLPDLGRTGTTATLLGRYVRILVRNESDAGSVNFDGETFDPIWWGVVTKAARDDDAAPDTRTAGLAHWECAGLGYLLEKALPIRGHELNAAGEVSDPGRILTFNANHGGDRSDTKYTVGPGVTAYVHDRGPGTDASPVHYWTALDVAEYLLNAHGTAQESSLRWTITGQTTALAFSEKWDLRGLTVMQALIRLVNSRRGVSFRIIVVNGQPTLDVTTTLPAALTTDSGTVPANSAQSSVTFAGQRWLENSILEEDEGPEYDEIIVRGPDMLVTATLVYKPDGTGDLVKGWDDDLEASWTSTTKDTKFEEVWRRFRLRDDWGFLPTINASGSVPNTHLKIGEDAAFPHSTANSAIFGDGGLVGSSAFVDDGTPSWAATTVAFERLTALYQGYDYVALLDGGSELPGGTVDQSRPCLPPLVFKSTDSGSTWNDISTSYTVKCDSKTSSIMLGNGITEAAAIKTLLASSSARLAFTVSFFAPFPSLVSWRRPRDSWPHDFPRRLVVPAGSGRVWRILIGTMVGSNAANTAPKQIAANATLLDETSLMRAQLAGMLPWYSNPDRKLSWVDRANVDSDSTLRPGAMVTTAVFGDRSVTINGVVTRRAWDLTDSGWSTSYRVERLKSDLEAIR